MEFDLPNFTEIFRRNVAFLTRPKKFPQEYPGYCKGNRETERRARQIAEGKLQHDDYETVVFD